MGICNNSAIKDDSCSICCCFCLDLLENGKFCSKFRSPHLPLDRLVEYGPFNPQNETCFLRWPTTVAAKEITVTFTVKRKDSPKKWKTSRQKEKDSLQKKKPPSPHALFYAAKTLFFFCREVISLAVSLLLLICRKGYSFCREVFSLAVRLFLLAVRFFILPWVFFFAEKLFLLPWQLWATVVFLIGSEYLTHSLNQSDAEFRNQLVACVFPCMTPATFTQGSYVPVLWFFSFLSVAIITWGLVIRHSTGEKWHSESSTSMQLKIINQMITN